MKKITKKLSLDKEIITTLDKFSMEVVKGGDRFTEFLSLGRICHSNNHPTDCKTTGNTCGGPPSPPFKD